MTMKTMRFDTHKATSTTTNTADEKPPLSPAAVQVSYKRDGLVLTRSSYSYVSTTAICKSPPASPPRNMTRPGSPVHTKEYADEEFFCYDSDDEEDLEQDELFGLAFVQEE
mmetsp:Transcript_5177/g.7879  ORF Transcript_5177/g.7879 Transcript_5177/m.7879 type:complete len:111 (-) Transcript_5177:297-629(-)